MRRQRVDLKSLNKQATPQEIKFNIWYHNNLKRLGILNNLDNSSDEIDFYPFNLYNDYLVAELEATSLLSEGKQVPKELKEKLIEVAKRNNRI